MVHAASSSAQQVESGALLVFLLQEDDSHAAYFLRKQGLDRLTLLRAIVARRRTSRGAGDARRSRTRQPGAARAARGLRHRPGRAGRARADRSADRPRSSKSSAWCRCCAGAARTTRCWSASRASARPRWPKGWPCASSRATCPTALKNARVFALDLGALVAGTRYRGDFEERVKQVLDALEKQPHAILFIDEIHTLVGAGSASGGTMDAGNLLKPALASGTLRCIGSTTFTDVKQSFDKDRALSRRFQKIEVLEPIGGRDDRDPQGAARRLRAASRRDLLATRRSRPR